MLTSYEILKINEIVYQAGNEILKIYDTTFEVEIKDDNSPLTIADKKSHQIIEKGLNNLFPNIPILSEEGISIDYSQRSKWKKYWLIDPLDGTKEFVKKNGEFTVNIALIENGKSIFGSVYAPYTKELFWAHKGMGSWKSLNKKKANKLCVSKSLSKKRIVISRSHPNNLVQSFINQFNNYELIRMGSSLKLCIIAEGKADVFMRIGITGEWDTGASQCIVSEAGGSIAAANFEPLTYNQRHSLENPDFVVMGDQRVPWQEEKWRCRRC